MAWRQVGQEHGPARRVSNSCGLLTLAGLLLSPRAPKLQGKTSGPPEGALGARPPSRPDVTPYLDLEVSLTLPTASNH